MEIKELKATAQTIIDTLPRAHYLKASTIEVTLSATAKTSYFNPSRFSVIISMNNIAEAIKGKEEGLTEAELETIIRGLVYHEISHALLTPADLFSEASFFGVNSQMANIIEDERIETLLANYYANVDFKANAKAIIEYHAPQSFDEWVFFGLRLRKAPYGLNEMLEAFSRFLEKTKKVNATNCKTIRLARGMAELLKELRAIFDKYNPKQKAEEGEEKAEGHSERSQAMDEASEGNDEAQEGGNSAEEGNDEAQEGGNSAEEGNDEAEEAQEAKEGGKGKEAEEAEPQEEAEDKTAKSAEEGEEIMESASMSAKRLSSEKGAYEITIADYSSDNDAKVGMLKAIIRNQGLGVSTAPTIGAYNGKFNVNRYIKDQHLTLKWFDKTLEGGEREARKAQKKVLNLWLDQSGSFRPHDETINGILKALSEIEASRNDFEWRLIRMDTHFVIERNRSNRISKSAGGNALPKAEIESCYAETNSTMREVNIVLFDGETGENEEFLRVYCRGNEELFKDCSDSMSYKNLKPFDNKRTIFITESSNTAEIKKVCPNAREVIEENVDYEGRLKANIIKAFDLLF